MKLKAAWRSGVSRKEVEAWPVFAEWKKKLREELEHKFRGCKVKIVGADVNKKTRQIYRLFIEQRTPGKQWPAYFVMCGPTVDVLTVLSDGAGTEYVVFVKQPREAVAEPVLSNPAGFIDEGEEPDEAGGREVGEELGRPNLKLVLTLLQARPLLASPGLISERTHFFQANGQLPPAELARLVQELQGKETGIAEEGEAIVVHVIPRAEVSKFAEDYITDVKTRYSLKLADLL